MGADIVNFHGNFTYSKLLKFGYPKLAIAKQSDAANADLSPDRIDSQALFSYNPFCFCRLKYTARFMVK